MRECLLIAVESLLPSVKETLCFCWRGLRWPWAARPSQCPVLYAAPAGQWLRNSIGLISPWMDADRRTILVHLGRNKPTFPGFQICFPSLCCPRVSGFSQVRNTCKHTVTAINVSQVSLVYIYLAYTALATARLLAGASSSSNSPLLPTVCVSLCQCEMNYATIFFYLLIFLTCGFILLSVALFVQWHIKKKKDVFSM